DMVKALDPAAELTEVRVVQKLGGKTGTWTHPALTSGTGTGSGTGTSSGSPAGSGSDLSGT
nr:hypothetical protein [Micromonospora sp. DSM 115978]